MQTTFGLLLALSLSFFTAANHASKAQQAQEEEATRAGRRKAARSFAYSPAGSDRETPSERGESIPSMSSKMLVLSKKCVISTQSPMEVCLFREYRLLTH